MATAPLTHGGNEDAHVGLGEGGSLPEKLPAHKPAEAAVEGGEGSEARSKLSATFRGCRWYGWCGAAHMMPLPFQRSLWTSFNLSRSSVSVDAKVKRRRHLSL